MTDVTLYEAVVTKANNTQTVVDALSAAIFDADPNKVTFEPNFDAIETTINNVKAWANAKILEADQEKVMSDFLAEMKVVFDKYSAKIEIGSDETGYGESYGSGETAVGIKLTATFEGVTSTKEINKAVIVGGDLV